MKSDHDSTLPETDESAIRSRILDAAERLWAQEGIGNVSLNRIRQAAGARNSSAISYHFGTKEDLVLAVRARHVAGVNRERLELLKQVDLSNRTVALRSIAEALIVPFSARLKGPSYKGYYVQFVAQFYSDPSWRVARAIRGQHDGGLRKADKLLQTVLTEVPAWVVNHRLNQAIALGIYTLANWDRVERWPKPPRSHLPKATVLALLADSAVGIFAAPTSAVDEQLRRPDRSQ